MLYFYDTNQFDQWYQDFEKITGCEISQDFLLSIKEWQNTNLPLSSHIHMDACSITCECYSISEEAVIP